MAWETGREDVGEASAEAMNPRQGPVSAIDCRRPEHVSKPGSHVREESKQQAPMYTCNESQQSAHMVYSGARHKVSECEELS